MVALLPDTEVIPMTYWAAALLTRPREIAKVNMIEEELNTI